MRLPEPIIFKILSYLSMTDVLHLCISKLFFPCLLNSPRFFTAINSYMLSLLCQLYIDDADRVRLKTATIPFIIDNTMYLAIHTDRVRFWRRYRPKHILLPFLNILELFSHLFLAFHVFYTTQYAYFSIIRKKANFINTELIAKYTSPNGLYLQNF
jgi:hypothetical protein